MNSEILGTLVIAKNGVELRSLAKKLGWNDLVSLSRELQALKVRGAPDFPAVVGKLRRKVGSTLGV